MGWDGLEDNDLNGYHVFELVDGSYNPDLSPGFTTTKSITITTPDDDSDHLYVVVAEDIHNNLGEPSDPVSLSDLGIDAGEGLPTARPTPELS